MEVINTIGRRKTSVARVYIKPGKGAIKVNARDLADYFPSEIYQIIVKQPLQAVNGVDQFDLTVTVEGGGNKGQAEAIRLGVARALTSFDGENRPLLKKEGLLTRDSRMVERKKPGRRKARKRFQFSKR